MEIHDQTGALVVSITPAKLYVVGDDGLTYEIRVEIVNGQPSIYVIPN